uniref:C2H2-type domain-containing protein n=1 Tax=Gadus morhua TaxID=8049 RepID=A0A8C5A8M8_GADMO
MPSKKVLPRTKILIPEPSTQISIDPFPSVTYTVVADEDTNVGSSSAEDSLSDRSNTRSCFVELASPTEGKKPLITREKQDTLKISLSANSTSMNKGLCLICNKHVQTDMKEHMKAHFPDGVLTCPRCDTVFKNMQSLRLHFKRVCFDQLQIEPDKVALALYQCDGCERSFKYKLQLNRHRLVHSQLYCEIYAKTLARHKVSHTPFQCTLCEKDFGFFKQLSRHYENTHKLSKPYKCNHCPKAFSKLRFFIRHEWKHTGQLPFQCSQCAMKFKQDADLVGHLRVHTNEKPYLCADCGKTFSRNSNLRRHVKFRHSESREMRHFTCTQCSKTFKEKGSLQKHEQLKHQNHKNVRHPCNYCGKMFSQSGMARHKMIHTGEKPLKCHIPDCNQRFRSPSEVKNHVLRHHTADRPFECNTCGKGFIRLAIHLRVHTHEKPFLCKDCGKRYACNSNLTRHSRMVHNESSKVKRFLGFRRSKEGARQKPHQKKRQMRQTPGPCKYCGTVLHSSRLCPQMSLSDNQSSLPHEMEAKDGSNIEKHHGELVSLLQAPSHVAPSQENFLSSSSTDRSSVALYDHDEGSVALKEQDAPLGKIPAANKTNSSTQRRLLVQTGMLTQINEKHLGASYLDIPVPTVLTIPPSTLSLVRLCR